MLNRSNGTVYEFKASLRITALGQQSALNEVCPLLVICETVLDAVRQSFIGMSGRALRIAPQHSQERVAVQRKRCGERESKTSRAFKRSFGGSSGLLWKTENPKCP